MAAPSSPFRASLKSSPTFSSFYCCNDYYYTPGRRRFLACSSRASSSLFCCCSSTTNNTTPQSPKPKRQKSPEPKINIPTQDNKDEKFPSINNHSSFKLSENGKFSFKAGFGRGALWRRILFASKKVRSIILLNVITVIYASNIPVVKEVEAFIDPEVFSVVRFVFSAIPFIPFVLQARDDVQTRNAGIELGFWVGLGYLMQALGLLTSDAGRASFISMFTVVVVPLLDGMLGSVIPARTWFGALMSIIGVGMLESSGSPPCVGDLFNFLSAIFFGVHMLRTEHISRSTTKENFLPLLGYEVCVVAIFSTIWYVIGGTQELNPSSWTWATVWDWILAFPWIPAIYTGIFSTGLCLWIELAAMRDVSATETAIIYGLEPVWGAGFAWFLLGERWGVNGWIGATLVLGGSLAVQICGVSSTTSVQKDKRSFKKSDDLLISDKQNVLSTTAAIVTPSKDSPGSFKK